MSGSSGKNATYEPLTPATALFHRCGGPPSPLGKVRRNGYLNFTFSHENFIDNREKCDIVILSFFGIFLIKRNGGG